MRRKLVITTGLAATMVAAGIGIATAAEAAVPTVNCPQVYIKVNVPAQAQAEVDNNLRLLDQQIDEANNRIAATVGQGGPQFIQNAILGPLKDKRFAAISRIETAISRNAARPNLNAAGLSTCSLNQNGGAAPVVTTPAAAEPGNNLGILTDSCDTSNLEPHDGFQKGNRCVSTEFGEVANANRNATLLITSAPRQVNRNQPFQIKVSTRNLIRDRFLAAGQGGYYVESSVLKNGITRGHFHTACRILDNTNQAPAPDPVPGFFVATEDGRGNNAPDTITIQVPGLAQSGEFQCSSWAGDGSHRIPMMQRANQTPALDSVRVRVR